MARKREIKKTARRFIKAVDNLLEYVAVVGTGQNDAHESLIYDGAIIHLYRLFEGLILEVLVGAINQDTMTFSKQTKVSFPKHLSDEVCEFLVTGGSYFDFKGRDGLIKTLKKHVPKDHYLLVVVSKPTYKKSLTVLSALRNHAAHNSEQSKRMALDATNQARIGPSGSWLKCPDQGKRESRFSLLCSKLKDLASEIEKCAPI